MEPDKKPETSAEADQPKEKGEQHAPADALSRTPEDLEAEQAAAEADAHIEEPTAKKVSPLKKFFHKVNVYFLAFVLLVAVGGAVTIVNYLNSKKAAPEASIANQKLTQDALKQLANSDASVGSASQTLT